MASELMHSQDELRRFCVALPKVDLHAHLSGCISKETLHKIWTLRKIAEPSLELKDPVVAMSTDGVYEHEDFFSIFSSYIYKLVDNVDALRLATEDTLKNYERDGVVHFEVRSTPRESKNMSKEVYVQTILSAIRKSNHDSPTMQTHLILSIDRRTTAAEALHTVDLAIAHQAAGVVGVDLCGDSCKGDISLFKDAFAKAKSASLYITLHFGEEPECLPELMTLLSYQPDRLGHILFLTPEAKREILRRKLGIELCLTSNIKGEHVPSYADHHLGEWLGYDCPVALCTDNVGVVGSPTSNEYVIAANNFQLSYAQLWEFSLKSVGAVFLDEAGKERCRERMRTWRETTGMEWLK